MKYLSIRLFEEEDVDFAYELIMTEKWNYVKEDVERMFRYNPLGCFIAQVEGKRVGHVFSVNYGKLGWIGLLIVKAECRGRSIGTLLMKKAMNHLLSHEVETIKLEAMPVVAELYRKLGFGDEYGSLRFVGVSRRFASASSSTVKSLKNERMKEIAKFDAEYFGANRIKVLSKPYHDSPKLCFVSYIKSKITGYVMCRKAKIGYRIGPWVCNSEHPKAAQELLIKCMETIGENEKLYVGVPAVNKAAIEILQDFDFRQYSKSIRMYFGKKLETERVNGIFAIGGPEKG